MIVEKNLYIFKELLFEHKIKGTEKERWREGIKSLKWWSIGHCICRHPSCVGIRVWRLKLDASVIVVFGWTWRTSHIDETRVISRLRSQHRTIVSNSGLPQPLLVAMLCSTTCSPAHHQSKREIFQGPTNRRRAITTVKFFFFLLLFFFRLGVKLNTWTRKRKSTGEGTRPRCQ